MLSFVVLFRERQFFLVIQPLSVQSVSIICYRLALFIVIYLLCYKPFTRISVLFSPIPSFRITKPLFSSRRLLSSPIFIRTRNLFESALGKRSR
jgi:hypothetical protein